MIKITKFWAIGLCLLLVSVTTACSGEQVEVGERIVHVTMGGTEFAIPEGYFDILERDYSETNTVSLRARLPDLSMGSFEYWNTWMDGEWSIDDTADGIDIFFTRIMPHIELGGIMENYLENRIGSPDAIAGRNHVSGLVPVITGNEALSVPRNELYVNEDDNNIQTIITCRVPTEFSNGLFCQQIFLYKNISIKARYRREYLEDWAEIQADILSLMAEFDTNSENYLQEKE